MEVVGRRGSSLYKEGALCIDFEEDCLSQFETKDFEMKRLHNG